MRSLKFVVWERVNMGRHYVKIRNCSKGAISFHILFSIRFEKFQPFSSKLKFSSVYSFSFTESKICRLGKGVNMGRHCVKRRDCSNWTTSFFHTVFSTRFENFQPFSSKLKFSSVYSFRLKESKKLSFWKGLTCRKLR